MRLNQPKAVIMIRNIFILCLFSTALTSCYDSKKFNDGDVTVSGKVLYKTSNAPVPKADIILVDATCNCGSEYDTQVATTDSSGNYEFTPYFEAEHTGMDNVNTYYVYAKKDSNVCEEGKNHFEIQREDAETYNFTIPN